MASDAFDNFGLGSFPPDQDVGEDPRQWSLGLAVNAADAAASDDWQPASVYNDEELELDQLRTSVRRLREQREAVQSLKRYAASKEREAAAREAQLAAAQAKIASLEQTRAKQWRLEMQLADMRAKLDQQAEELTTKVSS
eukprot:TRINITY_DN27257_c0_g1_i1.p1 TRINITY_DN27257_c0_g1~~TRINITY_DN27257_c0_g1_i1.p1  ORF type:complete len:140 (+),score=24.37 TRINITY_DN27257_c0_g1_i1:151-570(+)